MSKHWLIERAIELLQGAAICDPVLDKRAIDRAIKRLMEVRDEAAQMAPNDSSGTLRGFLVDRSEADRRLRDTPWREKVKADDTAAKSAREKSEKEQRKNTYNWASLHHVDGNLMRDTSVERAHAIIQETAPKVRESRILSAILAAAPPTADKKCTLGSLGVTDDQIASIVARIDEEGDAGV